MRKIVTCCPMGAARIVVVLIAAACCTVSRGPNRADARDIFVNNVAGDDRRDGGGPDSQSPAGGPVRTLSRALQLAEKGDRIILADTGEPYRESVTVQAGRHSGVAGSPFEIVGNGAVLDGTRPVPPEAWSHVRGNIFRFRPPRMAHQLLYLEGQPARRVPVDPSAGFPQLQPLEWCLFERHVYLRTEPGRDPASYELSHTALPVGITIYEARNVVIRRLVVQGFQLDGVNAHDGAFDVTLAGLNCRGNGRSGISVGGASRVVVESCLLGNNGAAQLRTEGQSHTHVINSDLIGQPHAPALVRDGGEVTVRQPPRESQEPQDAATPGNPTGGEAPGDR